MQPTWRLSELLNDILAISIDAKEDIVITGLALDSRKVKPGDLFLAFKGHVKDGHGYIEQAIKNGAAAILCEDVNKIKSPYPTLPIISAAKLVQKIPVIASKFFGEPSNQLHVIGITGTNGKTSISQLIAKALSDLGYKTGIIGTLGLGFPGQLETTLNTTPDAITLQQKFAEFVASDAKAVAMEVSSHALVQHRVANINFTTAIFTNLTQDHLDYHKDMETYWQCKKQLFFMPKLKQVIINIDDEHGFNLIQELPKTLEIFAYSCDENNQHIKELASKVKLIIANNIKLSTNGISTRVTTPWGDMELKSKLLGSFNVSNLLAVLAALLTFNIPLAKAIDKIAQLQPIKGRMQVLGGGKKPLVVVDYAHTPDALEKALSALRPHCKGQIWCVFGCGGDRDRNKRPLMGSIAERLSDQIILTNDNPRSEDPAAIINDIVAGLTCPWAAEIEADRATAIAHAINCATNQDVVLIAGKGHEDYQIIGDKRLPFSDEEQATQDLDNYKL